MDRQLLRCPATMADDGYDATYALGIFAVMWKAPSRMALLVRQFDRGDGLVTATKPLDALSRGRSQ
jgi:hypothetical protein